MLVDGPKPKSCWLLLCDDRISDDDLGDNTVCDGVAMVDSDCDLVIVAVLGEGAWFTVNVPLRELVGKK